MTLIGQSHDSSPVEVDVSVSRGMGAKLLLPWRTDLSVYLSIPFPPSLPTASPEASQTQMFYTAYEMFEGHRKRKSARAWFPPCWAPWMSPGLLFSASCKNSSSAAWMYWEPSGAHVQSPRLSAPNDGLGLMHNCHELHLDVKMHSCSEHIQKVIMSSQSLIQIVHEQYWLPCGSLGSLGSITAGERACSFLRAAPRECRVLPVCLIHFTKLEL